MQNGGVCRPVHTHIPVYRYMCSRYGCVSMFKRMILTSDTILSWQGKGPEMYEKKVLVDNCVYNPLQFKAIVYTLMGIYLYR